MSQEKEELDITASFIVEDGVSGKTLKAAVEQLTGNCSFRNRLVRANDEGEWFEVGNGSQSPAEQCIVLGDDDLIKDDGTYKKVTVKFKPGSNSGMEYPVGYTNFEMTVLKNIREFRDNLKQKLAPQKKAKKK